MDFRAVNKRLMLEQLAKQIGLSKSTSKYKIDD